MNGRRTYVSWVRMSQGHFCLPPLYGLANMNEAPQVSLMFNNITGVYLSTTRTSCPSGTEPPQPPTCCALRKTRSATVSHVASGAEDRSRAATRIH